SRGLSNRADWRSVWAVGADEAHARAARRGLERESAPPPEVQPDALERDRPRDGAPSERRCRRAHRVSPLLARSFSICLIIPPSLNSAALARSDSRCGRAG